MGWGVEQLTELIKAKKFPEQERGYIIKQGGSQKLIVMKTVRTMMVMMAMTIMMMMMISMTRMMIMMM